MHRLLLNLMLQRLIPVRQRLRNPILLQQLRLPQSLHLRALALPLANAMASRC
jgi:hypothetical protein